MDNINRITKEQNDRTSTIPTRGSIQKPKPKRKNNKNSNNKQINNKQSNNKQQAPPAPPPPQQVQPQQPIPQTIILECNRLTSRQDEQTSDAYNTNHRWKTEFANGIQIRKGDEIKINSAYISSIGVGDLIAWDNIEGSQTQDNKAKWIMSYYGCNDALNDKREGYNMIKFAGDTYPVGGEGEFCYDVDNSACPLMRNTLFQLEGLFRAINLYMVGRSFTYMQDPYLPCRIFGERFTIKTPVIDNHFVYKLNPSDSLDNVNVTTATTITMFQTVTGGAFNVVDVRNLYSVGQTLYFQSQEEVTQTPPTLHYHPNHSQDWIFTISEIRENTTNQYVMVVDSLYNLTGLTHFLHNAPTYNTAKVSVSTLPYRTCRNETLANKYDHTSLSTIIFSLTDPNGGVSNADESNYVNVGDKYKQYAFDGIGTQRQLNDDTTLMNQVNDTQTGNEVFECEITETNRKASDCRLEIEIISLFSSDTTKTDKHRQQEIKFKFQPSITHYLINTLPAGRVDFITEFIGTNYFILDLYNPNYDDRREIATYFLINPTSNTGSAINILIDNTGVITLQGVRRNQNDDITNILADGQHSTNNKTVVDAQKYYFIITKQFFTDLTAQYTHETIAQYRSITWDWGLKYNTQAPPSTSPNHEVPYFVYIKDNDNLFTESTITTYNDRSDAWLENYSDTFNLTYEGYDWGVKQILIYSGYNAIEGETIEVKHYQQKEFVITQNYSSPANIATAITKQTHDVGLARDKNGNEVLNSKNQGLIQNEFYFPVWSSFENSGTNVNKEDPTTGKLSGQQANNSFFLKYNLTNPSVHIYDDSHTPPHPAEYHIYFRTRWTSVNRPFGVTINQNYPAQNPQPIPDGNYFTQDFRQTWIGPYSDINNEAAPYYPPQPLLNFDYLNYNGSINPYNIMYARSYSDYNQNAPLQNVEGFPIEYLPNTYSSQFCGANNISLSWDDSNSRFKFDYLHQTPVSKFIASDEGITQDSGNPSTTIYFPTPISRNGTPYKLPRTRISGVNIENWASQNYPYPATPAQIRKIANIDVSIDLASDWFIVDNSIDTATPQLQNNYNVIGNRFWNKLGFENDQIYNTFVGSEIDPDNGRYLPKGTTDNLVDVADAISTSKEPAENTPYYNTYGAKFDSGGSTGTLATFKYSSAGGMNTNNHLNGNGLPNTSGNPMEFEANTTQFKWNDFKSVTQFNQYESQYNPDRERNQSYTFTSIGDSMVAGTLPTKTEFPYFLVMSDLIKSDFYVSANQGANLNCLGVISKANAEQDFYFQYQAPQSFYATKDEIISSITTEIRTPSLDVPSALSPYSSIIYQITRYEPIPIQTSEPIWLQQQMAFGQITNLLQQLVTSNSVQPAITADEEMIVAGVAVPESVPNAPILENIPDMTTDQIELYEDMINVMRGRIRPPKQRVGERTLNLGDVSMNQPTAQGDREQLQNILPTQLVNDDDDASTVIGSDSFTIGTASTSVSNISLPSIQNQNVKDWEDDADSVIHSQGQVAPSYRSRAPTYRTLGTQRTETESEPTPSFRSNASTIVEEEKE